MSPISYDSIRPNIEQVRVTGAEVQVTWKCPSTGRTIATSSGWMSADSSLGNRVGASVKRSIAYEVIYGLARLISNLVGGAAGRVLSNATYTAAADLNNRATSGVDYTAASREAAILVAFEAVKSSFTWDESRNQFVAH